MGGVAGIPAWPGYYLYAAATAFIIAVYGHLVDGLGGAVDGGKAKVDGKFYLWLFAQPREHQLVHSQLVSEGARDAGFIHIYLVVLYAFYNGVFAGFLFSGKRLNPANSLLSGKVAGGDIVVVEVDGIVGGAVVGSKEDEVLAFAYGGVKIVEEIGEVAVEAEVNVFLLLLNWGCIGGLRSR